MLKYFKINKNEDQYKTWFRTSWDKSHSPALHHCPSTLLLPGEFSPLFRKQWYCLLSWDSPRLTSRHEEEDVLVCLVTSDVLIRIPPIQHPVMLHFKKLPVHHKHILPFMFPAWERKRGNGRSQPSLKHKLTALSRLTYQKKDVPDIHLNFCDKVTPQLWVTLWDQKLIARC